MQYFCIGITQKQSMTTILKEKPNIAAPTPFLQYMMQLDDAEYERVMGEIIEEACIIDTDRLLQYMYGIIRPHRITRRDIARVISRHSGDSSLTGDDLFPEKSRKKK